MAFDATFWVAVSFFIFFGALVYLKVPRKINELLANMITDIKKEIDESEKLRSETKTMLDEAQKKLDTADKEVNKILKKAKDDSEKLVLEMNEKFHNTSEIKKNTVFYIFYCIGMFVCIDAKFCNSSNIYNFGNRDSRKSKN